MQSISARSVSRSPGFDTVGRKAIAPSVADGDVHPDVEGLRHLGGALADGGERHPEVVGAVVVVVGDAEAEVAEEVAGGDQRVVDAGRGVLSQRQDRPAAVGDEGVADPRGDAAERAAGVLPREELGEVGGAERPEVADLGAVGVDERQALAAGEAHRPALAGGHGVAAAGLGPAVGGDRAAGGGVLAERRRVVRRPVVHVVADHRRLPPRSPGEASAATTRAQPRPALAACPRPALRRSWRGRPP